MAEILISCLEETDEPPKELLEVLLLQLVAPLKTEYPMGYKLSQTVIHRSETKLQSFVSSFLQDIQSLETESELFNQYYPLLFELSKVAPSLITNILPVLENHLEVNSPSFGL